MATYIVKWPNGNEYKCSTLIEAKRMESLGKAQAKRHGPGFFFGAPAKYKAKSRNPSAASVGEYAGRGAKKGVRAAAKGARAAAAGARSFWTSAREAWKKNPSSGSKQRARGTRVTPAEGYNFWGAGRQHASSMKDAETYRLMAEIYPPERYWAKKHHASSLELARAYRPRLPGDREWEIRRNPSLAAGSIGSGAQSYAAAAGAYDRKAATAAKRGDWESAEHWRMQAAMARSFAREASKAFGKKRNPGGKKQRARGVRDMKPNEWNTAMHQGYFGPDAGHARALDAASRRRKEIGLLKKHYGRPSRVIELAVQSHADDLARAAGYRAKTRNPSLAAGSIGSGAQSYAAAAGAYDRKAATAAKRGDWESAEHWRMQAAMARSFAREASKAFGKKRNPGGNKQRARGTRYPKLSHSGHMSQGSLWEQSMRYAASDRRRARTMPRATIDEDMNRDEVITQARNLIGYAGQYRPKLPNPLQAADYGNSAQQYAGAASACARKAKAAAARGDYEAAEEWRMQAAIAADFARQASKAFGKKKNGPLEQGNAIALLRKIPVGHMRVIHGLMVHRPGQNLWDVGGKHGDLLLSAIRLAQGKM